MLRFRQWFLIGLLLLFPLTVFGVRVAENELRQDLSKKIRFINYTGERQHTDPVESIFDIGKNLSHQVKAGKNRAGYGVLKYTLIHVVDPSQKDKLDADILQIDPLARVDHIFSIRTILAGYLTDQYGYSRVDAKSLAVFITYYNAYYRKNTNYFGKQFKGAVNRNLDPAKIGLSTSYEDWPGNSQIVIPLTEGKAKPSELANDSVLSNMRQTKDKNIESRQNVNELRKKELENKKQVLNQTNAQLVQKEQKLQQKKQELQKTEQQLSEESNRISSLPEGPEKKQKEQELQKKNKEIQKSKTELDKQKKAIQSQKQEVQKKKKDLKQEEEKVSQEDKNIRSDQADLKIKKDSKAFEKELKKKDEDLSKKEKKLAKIEQQLKEGKTDRRIAAGKLYYLKVKDYMIGGHYNNEMYLIDVVTHKIIKKSSFTNICGKDYHVFKDGVVVIGHGGGKDHSSGHFLVLLDGDTLEVKAKGNADVFWRSFVEIRNDSFYAVILKDRLFYLAKFDSDLQLVDVSPKPVFKDTFISFFGDVLYVSSQNKGILVLKQSDLSLVDTVNPE